jgi:excisionase family DNA binding protein
MSHTSFAHSVSSADDDPQPLVVRPRVAWRLLDCGNAYGYRLIAAGELESYRDGRARKITVKSIHHYIMRRLAEGGCRG